MDNRDLVMAYAKANFPEGGLTPLEATYLIWMDCRALELEQEELMRRIFEAHVKVNDGLSFGEKRARIYPPEHRLSARAA